MNLKVFNAGILQLLATVCSFYMQLGVVPKATQYRINIQNSKIIHLTQSKQ